MKANFDYFRRRAQEEREAAMKAEHPAARQAHRDMADRYEALSTAIESHQLPLHSVSAA